MVMPFMEINKSLIGKLWDILGVSARVMCVGQGREKGGSHFLHEERAAIGL
jgi:hypothetical protein